MKKNTIICIGIALILIGISISYYAMHNKKKPTDHPTLLTMVKLKLTLVFYK